MDRTHSPINSILEQAAYIVRRKKKQQERLNQQRAIREGKQKN